MLMLANISKIPYDVHRFANLAGRAHRSCPSYERQRQLGRMVSFEMLMFCLMIVGRDIYDPHQESHTSSATGVRMSQKQQIRHNNAKAFGWRSNRETWFSPHNSASISISFLKSFSAAVSAKPGALTFTILSNGNVVKIWSLTAQRYPAPRDFFGGLFKFLCLYIDSVVRDVI